jgi:hypothetical protein
MRIVDVVNFTVQNWEIIVGLVFFAVHLGLKWGIIRSEKITALYTEAIAYGDQMKKQAGLTTGVELSGEQVLDLVLDYLQARVPTLHAIDVDKIEALLNVKNTQRDAGASAPPSAKQVVKDVEIGAVQQLLANAQRYGWKKLQFPQCLWEDQR